MRELTAYSTRDELMATDYYASNAHRQFSPLAGVLSYLVPGLGQLYQGRVAKGLLFLVCLYSLFFYGMALGNWQNVYIPDAYRVQPSTPLKTLGMNIYSRLQFVGQFWIGAAAWPAIYQYATYDDKEEANKLLGTFQRSVREEEVNRLQREGDKSWDLGWVYTVIAGVLNILVMYDAFAGPAMAEAEAKERREEEPQPA